MLYEWKWNSYSAFYAEAVVFRFFCSSTAIHTPPTFTTPDVAPLAAFLPSSLQTNIRHENNSVVRRRRGDKLSGP